MSTMFTARQTAFNRESMEALLPSRGESSTRATNVEMSMSVPGHRSLHSSHPTKGERSETVSILSPEMKLLEQSLVQTYAKENRKCLPSRVVTRCAARCHECKLAKTLKSAFRRLFRRRNELSQAEEERQPQRLLPVFQSDHFTPISSSLSLPEECSLRSIDERPETTETIEARKVDEERLREAACIVVNEMDDDLREAIMATPLPDVQAIPSGWALVTPPRPSPPRPRPPPPQYIERHEAVGHFGSYGKLRPRRLPVRARTQPLQPPREPSTTPNHPSLCPSFYWKKPSPCPSRTTSMHAGMRVELPPHLDTPEQQAEYETLVDMAQKIQLSAPSPAVAELGGEFESLFSDVDYAQCEKRRDSKNKTSPGSSTKITM